MARHPERGQADGEDEAGHFESTYIRTINALPFGFMGLVGLFAVGSGVGGLIFGLAFALICSCLVIRGLRMGVSYSDKGVTIRGFARTRKWPWAAIEQFGVEVNPVGALNYRRKVLTVTFKDGTTKRLREQNASPKESDHPSWVEEAAVVLNRELVSAPD